MADSDKSQDPSMEDILASIRKIIDEDDKKAGGAGTQLDANAAPGSGDVDDEDDVLELEEIVEDDDAAAADADDEPLDLTEIVEEDEPLDLTEVVEDEPESGQSAANDDGSESIEATTTDPEPEATREPQAATEPEPGPEPEPEREPEAVPEPEAGAEPEPADDEMPDAQASDDAAADDMTHVPQDARDAVVAPAVPEDEPAPAASEEESMSNDGLMSDNARNSAAAALGSLAKASERDPLEDIPRGRPVEDLVMEQLTPMLSAWLDEHLPSIVERIVEREVRYLSRRLGATDD